MGHVIAQICLLAELCTVVGTITCRSQFGVPLHSLKYFSSGEVQGEIP